MLCIQKLFVSVRPPEFVYKFNNEICMMTNTSEHTHAKLFYIPKFAAPSYILLVGVGIRRYHVIVNPPVDLPNWIPFRRMCVYVCMCTVHIFGLDERRRQSIFSNYFFL